MVNSHCNIQEGKLPLNNLSEPDNLEIKEWE